MPYLTPAERIGTTVAQRYRVERLIGQGGMGAVFRATHTWTDRAVALKVLLPHHVGDDAMVARFLQEAKAATRLRHANVVDVLDMGRGEDDSVFLVMELLEGCALSSMLAHAEAAGRAGLPAAHTLGVVLPLLDALRSAHASGIVHRDLKPDNIFLSRTTAGGWVPKLLDFGIAKLARGSDVRTRSGVVLGTPRYMSPEQASGEETGPPTDVWAMGIVLYECLAGAGPFQDANHMQLLLRLATQEVPSLATVVPGLDPGLVAVVDRALSRSVAERYPDGGGFADALAEAASAAGVRPTLRDLEAVDAGGEAPPTRATLASARRPAPTTGSRTRAEATRTTGRTGVTVVRPYGPRIRSRVFPLFEAAGLEIDPAHVIPSKTGDEEAIARIRAAPHRALLVPFHGHRDEAGVRLDGLALLRKLEARSTGAFRWRVVMPVSSFARAGVTLAMSRGTISEALRARILLIFDDELDRPGLAERIASHVSADDPDAPSGAG